MKMALRITAALSLLGAVVVQAAGDAEAGRQKAAVCAACHGIDGNSTIAQWPKLAGQHADYLARQIRLIRDGARPVPEMTALVAGLDEQDIADLAAYYAAQAPRPGAADESLVTIGERLYRAGNPAIGIPACMACHGPAGEGNPLAGYPVLAGQHSVYTANMLNRFKAGENWGLDDAPSGVMNGVARRLTEEEIAAVASYIQGLY